MSNRKHIPTHHKHRIAWKWEIAAALGCLITLAGMIVILAVNDRKEVFTWHGVTLNAVVSLLFIADKTMLLFSLGESIGQWKWIAFSREPRLLIDLERVDSASRGPLGGAHWLWISMGKQRSFLQIAALVTILTIAIDPFSQQLIQTEQKLKYFNDGITKIATAMWYPRGTTFVPAVVPVTMTAIADCSLQAGTFNALIQPYEALVQQTTFRIKTSYLTKNATIFQLKNGLFINTLDGAPFHKPKDYPVVLSDQLQTVFMTYFATGNASRTNTFRDTDNLLWAMSFLKMKASSNDPSQSNGWPNVPAIATECGLFYCVNQYSSNVRNGRLYETETVVENVTRNPDSWKLINWIEPDLGGRHIDNHTLNSLEFNNSTSSVCRTDLMFGDGFNFSWAAVNSFSSQLQTQFIAEKSINTSDHKNYSIALDYTPINGFYRNQINDYDPKALQLSPSVMQILYNSPDLNDTFQRLARGMSNAIRVGADNSLILTGTSGVMTVYYRIQWPWIVLHIIVVIGGISFLLNIILQSKRTGVPIWKSSVLAMLSLSNEIGDVLVASESVEDMKAKASQEFMRLFRG